MVFMLTSCSTELMKISDERFVGIWEIKGDGMLEGVQVMIHKENNKLVGRLYKLNQNKYVKLFADSSMTWIPEIKRSSNFEFKLIEKKIGSELFSLYGQKTTQDFNVRFIDENTIGLATENSDPLKSTRIYRRVK